MTDKEIFAKLPDVLLPWYKDNARDLPWRQDQDPYHVWISEIMLQQTRVEAVKGYYQRFLQTLPDIASLANADDELLHKLWEGLGYYSRVRNLKKAALQIMETYQGQFPNEHDKVLKLPGIGLYTAGAICSISFSLPTPAVDGNVLRVVARLTNDDTPIDQPSYQKSVRDALAEIYPREAGAFTQALMELGATVCGPNRKPQCEACPCEGFCKARKADAAQLLPVKLPKKGRQREEMTVFILSCQGDYALCKRPSTGLLADLWEFPNVSGKLETEAALSVVEKMGLKPQEIIQQVERKHIFTHIEWDMRGVYVEIKDKVATYQWLSAEQIRSFAALPTAFRQFFELIPE